MSKTWLILDCNYLCHRAKYTTGGLSYGETPTGIIYGFLKTVSHFQEHFNTPYVIFCWDSKTNKREEIFPAYKQKRRSKFKEWTEEESRFENAFRLQMRKLHYLYLKKIGYKNVFSRKGYESDDVIASICHDLSSKDEAIIVSSDQDLYQLIQHNISFYNPQKNKILTLQGFKKLYGIIPYQWISIKAIAGCSTDEVPGVEGVGEKTAIKYLTGKLKKRTKAYKAICSKKGNCIIERNLKLVKLPFEEIGSFKLREDRISKQGWREVTTRLGMKSIRDKAPMTQRKRK